MPKNNDDKFDASSIEAAYVQVSDKPVAYTVSVDDSLKIDYDASGNAVGYELCSSGPKSQPTGREIDLAALRQAGERNSRGAYSSSFGSPPSGTPPTS
jgi:hypothetical protein